MARLAWCGSARNGVSGQGLVRQGRRDKVRRGLAQRLRAWRGGLRLGWPESAEVGQAGSQRAGHPLFVRLRPIPGLGRLEDDQKFRRVGQLPVLALHLPHRDLGPRGGLAESRHLDGEGLLGEAGTKPKGADETSDFPLARTAALAAIWSHCHHKVASLPSLHYPNAIVAWHNRRRYMAVASELAEASARGVDPKLLDYELQRRGKEWVDLARADPTGTFRLNPTTVVKLRHRRPVNRETLHKLNGWLAATPVLPEIDRLLVPPRLQATS